MPDLPQGFDLAASSCLALTGQGGYRSGGGEEERGGEGSQCEGPSTGLCANLLHHSEGPAERVLRLTYQLPILEAS